MRYDALKLSEYLTDMSKDKYERIAKSNNCQELTGLLTKEEIAVLLINIIDYVDELDVDLYDMFAYEGN